MIIKPHEDVVEEDVVKRARLFAKLRNRGRELRVQIA
jgi:hypothetical protein